MPSASTSPCVECHIKASKYTCPKCGAKTCSLACTKAHNAPTSTSCATSSSNGAASPTAMAASPRTATSSSVSGYVPLSKYNESTMLQDYLFLSSLSRTTAEKGREIVRMNLLPSSSASNNNDGTHPNSSHTRMTNQQRQREQLMKQIHYRKYNIMLLPDGMARRKSNQTSWNPKDRKMTFTVQLIFPNTSTKAPQSIQEDGKQALIDPHIVHKVEADRSVHHFALSELEKRSFPNRKDLVRHRESLGVSSSLTKQASLGKEMSKWIVSRSLVQDHMGLPLPIGGDDDVVVLEGLPEHWQLLVPVFSSRLTNESTAKYLDWWNRKRKWEEANPEQPQLTPTEQQHTGDKSSPQRPQQKQRVWGAQLENNDAGQTATETSKVASLPAVLDAGNLNEAAPPVASSPIIPSSLLAMLSQRLGRSAPPLPDTTSSTEALPETKVSLAEAQAETSLVEPSGNEPSKTKPTKSQTAEHHPSTFVHLAGSETTIHDLMAHAIPDGYSIVEFPIIEIRDSRAKPPTSNEVLVIYPILAPDSESVEHAGPESDAQVLIPEPLSDNRNDQKEQVASPATHVDLLNKPEPVSRGLSQGLAGFLGGYASDSD